jgi:hypothetical protein
MRTNRRRTFAATALIFLLCGGLIPLRVMGQHAVDPSMRYFRVVALVHLTGAGTLADPIRPEYVPAQADATRQGIIAWSVLPTDDKKMAIVHLVAVNHHAFDQILADKRPEVKVFEVGKTPKAAIEAAFGLAKAGFDLSKFQVVAQ